MLVHGIPLALSVTALSCTFNYKFSEWFSGASKSNAGRDAELRRHGYLLASGALSVVPTILGGTNPLTVFGSIAKGLTEGGGKTMIVRPTGQMALAGLAWGGAATIVTGVCQEWDHYDDGWKVAITGGSLFGLLAGAMLM